MKKRSVICIPNPSRDYAARRPRQSLYFTQSARSDQNHQGGEKSFQINFTSRAQIHILKKLLITQIPIKQNFF